MEIDKAKCVGCGNYYAIYPMGAISLDVDGKSIVDQDECVECSTCHRVLKNEGYPPWLVRAISRVLKLLRLQYVAEVDVCPIGALMPPDLEWPRSLRAAFIDPTVVHAMKQVIAVDAFIVKDGRILLAKRSEGGLSPGCWSIPGGGVEFGEAVDDTLAREIREELNLEMVSYRLWNAYSVMHEDIHVVALYYVGDAEGDLVVDVNEVT